MTAKSATIPIGAPAARGSGPGRWAATRVFIWRSLIRIRQTPEALIDILLTPVLTTVVFNFLFGGAIAGSTDAYIQFLIPGVLVTAVALNTVMLGHGLHLDVSTGVFDRFRTLDIWRAAPLVGVLITDIVRYLLAGTAVLVVGLLLGYRPEGGLGGVIGALTLLSVFCFAITWIWAWVGLVVRTPQTVISISMGAIFALSFFSNVFVDPATMPAAVEFLVDANPLSFAVTALRGLTAGDPELGEIGVVLAMSAAIVAVFAPLTVRRLGAER